MDDNNIIGWLKIYNYTELICEYIKIDFPSKEDFEVSHEIIERIV